MPKKLFLGQASHFTRKERLAHTFSFGLPKDSKNLKKYLAKRYDVPETQVLLTKNGRSALAIALKSELEPGDEVIINGFTCYAVIESLKAANLKPVFADINEKTAHFDAKTLENALKLHKNAKAVIIQNTYGIPVDIKSIEKVAKENNLKIFEDLAHCVGVKYEDGREVGTVGIASALSFGKEKSIDSIIGGALIFNIGARKNLPKKMKAPRLSDMFRARFYPLFGAIYRGLSHINLETPWMAFLIKTHQVERSANSKLEINRRPPHFVAKTALKQFKKLPKNRQPIRKFMLVENRDEILKKLKEHGYNFDGPWFETPIAPARFYKKANFPENECKNAVEFAKKVINLPTHYKQEDLKPALKLIEEETK